MTITIFRQVDFLEEIKKKTFFVSSIHAQFTAFIRALTCKNPLIKPKHIFWRHMYAADVYEKETKTKCFQAFNTGRGRH